MRKPLESNAPVLLQNTQRDFAIYLIAYGAYPESAGGIFGFKPWPPAPMDATTEHTPS
jgi:hypothetical protein